MPGKIYPVWSRTWKEIWLVLLKNPAATNDIFIELTRGLSLPPRPPPVPRLNAPTAREHIALALSAEQEKQRSEYEAMLNEYARAKGAYDAALSSEELARHYFHGFLKRVNTEAMALDLLQRSHEVLTNYEDGCLAVVFRDLTKKFFSTYGLRYEIVEPFNLSVTMPGMLASILIEIRRISEFDPDFAIPLAELEEAFADLAHGRTSSRMKTTLLKQFHLLEALAQRCPNVKERTLGSMCNELDFPHPTIREIGKKLYGFGSDYSGIRHGSRGKPLQEKDFLSISLLLAAFIPYVTHDLDVSRCYVGE